MLPGNILGENLEFDRKWSLVPLNYYITTNFSVHFTQCPAYVIFWCNAILDLVSFAFEFYDSQLILKKLQHDTKLTFLIYKSPLKTKEVLINDDGYHVRKIQTDYAPNLWKKKKERMANFVKNNAVRDEFRSFQARVTNVI